jgi:hypothetical protein
VTYVSRILAPLLFCLSVTATALAQSLPHTSGNAPCADMTVLDSRPLTSLPQRTQEQIRTAVKPAVEAIVRDPGMGLQDRKVDEIALNAFPVAKDSDSELYAVSWNDRSFGVNEPVWLVELKLNGAKNLLHETRAFSLWGFGIAVLSTSETGHPEVMIASKGFKTGGGAEAENLCMEKRGLYYEQVACPATCHHNLNSR